MDPVYATLFRPDELAPEVEGPEFEAPDSQEPIQEDTPFEPIVDPVVDPRIEELLEAAPEEAPSAPAAPDANPIVDTGRLFRSQGVHGHQEAVLALTSDHFGRLRTLDRREEAGSPGPGVISVGGGVPDGDAAAVDDGVELRGSGDQSGEEVRSSSHGARRITGGAVYIIVIGVTVLVGFANALLADGDVGWPTGVALLVSSVYAALTVRRSDDVVAIIVPPLAFLLTAMTAGQLMLGSAEGSLLNRAVIVFFTLADNWFWVIGSTLAALVIVLVRRRRG